MIMATRREGEGCCRERQVRLNLTWSGILARADAPSDRANTSITKLTGWCYPVTRQYQAGGPGLAGSESATVTVPKPRLGEGMSTASTRKSSSIILIHFTSKSRGAVSCARRLGSSS